MLKNKFNKFIIYLLNLNQRVNRIKHKLLINSKVVIYKIKVKKAQTAKLEIFQTVFQVIISKILRK